MKLYRFRIVPESPWRTPWQSDTLAGLLCWACARSEGDAVLRREIVEPALEGRPPFVLSDAFPSDRLPVPMVVRLTDWPAADRKMVKRARWLSEAAFRRVQAGGGAGLSDLIPDAGVHEYVQLRNTIGRDSNTTAREGGLFPTDEAVLDRGVKFLSVYARIQDGFADFFWRLLQELAGWGFGADRSAGKGQFRLESGLGTADALDGPAGAGGCVVLSTFQPAADDPTDGAWDAFTKYGKLGPDFGLENVFKRPMILLRPGGVLPAAGPEGMAGTCHSDGRAARPGRREDAGISRDRRDTLGFRAVCAADVWSPTWRNIGEMRGEMGVYHLMGLGQSAGTVTGPLSYLAMRFERWDAADRGFFGGSGEAKQRRDGEKIGDVQALILFTTQEVFDGKRLCNAYVENQPGQCPRNQSPSAPAPMREALRRILPCVWHPLAKGRRTVPIYWAIINHTDLLGTFQRAVAAILAAKSSGNLGKELWINLTGLNNVVNLALQLAAGLSGASARFYYVQAADDAAARCIRFTRDEGYWVELPLLPVQPHEASRKLIGLVTDASHGTMEIPALFTQAKQRLWQHLHDVESLEAFKRSYVQPLVFQELLERDGDRLRAGRRWPLVEPFYRTLDAVGKGGDLRQLTQEPWFTEEELELG